MVRPKEQEHTVWEKETTPTERLVVKVIITKSGEPYVDVRRWFAPDAGGDWLPTKRGVRVHAEQLADLGYALREADRKIEELYG